MTDAVSAASVMSITHDSLGPSVPTTQTASQSVQTFLHRWPQSVPILYNWCSHFCAAH